MIEVHYETIGLFGELGQRIVADLHQRYPEFVPVFIEKAMYPNGQQWVYAAAYEETDDDLTREEVQVMLAKGNEIAKVDYILLDDGALQFHSPTTYSKLANDAINASPETYA